jgi:hypothetical protein
MKYSALMFVMVSLPVAATSGHVSLRDLMREIRDSEFLSVERKESLEFTRHRMQELLASELNVKTSELNLTLVRNPARQEVLTTLPWRELVTEYYTTLHLEALHHRWNALGPLVNISDYGKNIKNSLLAQWGNFSAVEEGRYYQRSHSLNIKTPGRNFPVKIPYFLMSEKNDVLLNNEGRVPYQELSGIDLTDFERNTKKLTPIQKQEVAERKILNRRIVSRAVANGAKTIVSLYNLTGLMNKERTTEKLTLFVDNYCTYCSTEEKRDMIKSAFAYADSIAPTLNGRSVSDISKNFCGSLRQNNYKWNIDSLRPHPIEMLQDKSRMADYYLFHRLNKINKAAIAKTILQQDFGILFITNAINIIDKKNGEPVGTNLGCVKETSSQDQVYVRIAIEEAYKNILKYSDVVKKQITEEKEDLPSLISTLDYLVQTNQSATAQALAAFPQGTGYVLKSIVDLDQKIERRKKRDKVVTWGGTIVGMGLVLTGVFAPKGVAIYVSLAWVIKGMSHSSYYFVRSQQERLYFEQMLLSYKSNGKLSEENLRHHYKEHRALKIKFIKELGSTLIDFYGLQSEALKLKNGDVKKAHALMTKVFGTAKRAGKNFSKEKIKDMIIDLAMSEN